MAATLAPGKGMLVRIPVGRRGFDGSHHLLPGFKASPFECGRTQDLPPGLD